jgi:hypothetical protein
MKGHMTLIAVNITSQAFAPRYSIDFIPTGPVT